MIGHVHESNLIEGIDSQIEDAQSLVAWNWLMTRKQITHDVIKKLQKRITINQTDLLPNQRGYYRDMSGTNVRVGMRMCPLAGDVPYLMDQWLDHEFGQLEPIHAHVRFEHIHPFVDGNGRTGRMLLWWDEVHNGPGKATLFLNSEKHENYYKLF